MYNGTDNLEIMANAVNYNKFLISILSQYIKTDATVLDFGAGLGTFASSLKGRCKKMICVDNDNRHYNILKKQPCDVYKNLKEIPEASVDFVYTLNVLEHIEKDIEILKEIRMKMKHNSILMVYVPAFQALYSAMDKKVGHYRRYTKKDLGKKLQIAGFTVENIKYCDSLGFFASLLYKIFNKTGNINKSSLVLYDKVFFPVSTFCDVFLKNLLGKNIVAIARKI